VTTNMAVNGCRSYDTKVTLTQVPDREAFEVQAVTVLERDDAVVSARNQSRDSSQACT
jgi:hypothetical protein